jgi:NADH-quinone oxidoreductase subunit M
MVGLLYERTRTRDIGRLGGVASVTPKMAAMFLVAGLASMGLPGLNNFVSEFLVIVGTFGANRVWGSIAVAGVLLSAIYFLWAYQRAMHGPIRGEHASARDLTRWEYAVIVPVVAVILFLGVYPKPVLDRVNPATCLAAVAVRNPGYEPLTAVCDGAGPAAGLTRVGRWTSYGPPNGTVTGGP